jgi:hypothetical protein
MTNWYNPVVLLATAIRVAISTVFGQLADRREAIAAANAIEPQPFDPSFDYSEHQQDFWFDYLADTGDGWNSTYAMARLLSDDAITADGSSEPLPRGRVLFLGGDQVYPTASRTDYDERFVGPFEEAYAPGGVPRWNRREQHLYAIPGNHDWYDGLSAFLGLFCRRRIKPKNGIGFDRPGKVIAGRETHQTRSYFAVRLPGNWWVWGTDSQLEGYIDQPQIDFFRHVGRHWMAPGSKLILCVGQPSWAYAGNDPKAVFSNFSYLERIAGAETSDAGAPMNHELKLVLTGDSHHYARFTEGTRQYVTCGGGGAFLHPTHQLRSTEFDWDYPPPGQEYERGTYRRGFQLARTAAGEEAVYPGKTTSRLLSLWNLAFAAINYWFTATLFIAYALFHWLLDYNARLTGGGSLRAVLDAGSFGDAFKWYWELVILSPAAAILILAGFGAYYYAADARHGWKRLAMGGAHALAQALVVTTVTCLVMPALRDTWLPLEIGIAALVAAVASATTYGLYLLVSLLGFCRHWNEGFSSFAHRGYKSMLRMRISADGALTIFPIGLDRVPKDRSSKPRNPALEPKLIEDPIIIP